MENAQTLKQLDFEPPLSVQDGIKKMVEAYKKEKW